MRGGQLRSYSLISRPICRTRNAYGGCVRRRPFFSGACRDFWVESPYTFCHSFFLQAGIALFAGADISMVLGQSALPVSHRQIQEKYICLNESHRFHAGMSIATNEILPYDIRNWTKSCP